MSDTPERIVAWWPIGQSIGGCVDRNQDIIPEHGLGSEVEYLRADLVPQWQPIETAPKDGTVVLLGRADYYPKSGYWVEHEFQDWWGWDRDRACPPTHWMPLPEPPQD